MAKRTVVQAGFGRPDHGPFSDGGAGGSSGVRGVGQHVRVPLSPESAGHDAGHEPPAKGRYRHFKGNEYEVIDVARHSESMEWMVVYRRVAEPDSLWVRPLHMWNEQVDRDGYVGPRFAWLGHHGA